MLSVLIAAAQPLPEPMPTAARFDCGGTTVSAVFNRTRLGLTVGGRRFALTQAASASGARYLGRDGRRRVEFWNKGDEARLTIGRRVYPACFVVPKDRSGGVAYRAVGQEPGWALTITPEGRDAVLTYDYGQKPVSDRLGPITANAQGATVRRGLAGRLDVRTFPGGCQDAMSGQSYLETVQVTVGGHTLKGCGGPDMPRIEGEWRVERIGDAAVLAGTDVTIAFAGDRATGKSGCNRFSGRFLRDNAGITAGPFAGTRMACAPPLMTQEARFLRMLEGVTATHLRGDGALVLTTPTGAIVARRKS